MYSKTFGNVSVNEMVNCIKGFILSDKNYKYKITVGTDSQNRSLTKVVVVVAVHRIGRGGIFFYEIKYVPKITNVRQKIYYETALSLELASKLSKSFEKANIKEDIEIHVDIGTNKNGKTFELISEITGWITGTGYKYQIKPYSYAASCIADRISK
ncbi:MAG: ribonuclease H-like YkuK family protein [Clostridium sp.]|uniref:ribonuclease H-like YkuK family protein n=1 Tax=Clostridium sp. TaxID=1506 RepID=UPI0039EB0AEE